MIYNMRGDTYHAGPVMLSDVYTSAVGSAKDGVAASQRALYDAYNSLNSSKVGIARKGSNGDFNNLTDCGIFRIDSGWSNGPAHSAYDQVFVARGSADTIGQMVFRHDTPEIYFRTGNPLASSNAKWNGWRTIAGTDSVVVERKSASYSSIAAGGSLELKMNLAKTGYNGIPGYAYTCTKVVVNNVYNQHIVNDGRVNLINLGTSAQAGTVYVYMIYIRT